MGRREVRKEQRHSGPRWSVEMGDGETNCFASVLLGEVDLIRKQCTKIAERRADHGDAVKQHQKASTCVKEWRLSVVSREACS